MVVTHSKFLVCYVASVDTTMAIITEGPVPVGETRFQHCLIPRLSVSHLWRKSEGESGRISHVRWCCCDVTGSPACPTG